MNFTPQSPLVKTIFVSLLLGLFLPTYVMAATTPSLGTAATYGVLSSTYTNTSATTVNGDVGFTTPPAVTPSGVRTNYGSGGPYVTAGIDQANALTLLASQACTFTFAPGAVNLSTDTTHGAVGVYNPGVYCSSGAMNVGGSLTLTGSGTFIFRPDGALTTTASAVIVLQETSSCDIFWTPTGATTLAANSNFSGTVINNAGITVGANTVWNGKALAFGGTVTTDTDTISSPACASVTLPPVTPALLIATTTQAPTSTQPIAPPLLNVAIAQAPTSTPPLQLVASATPLAVTVEEAPAPQTIFTPQLDSPVQVTVSSTPAFPNAGLEPEGNTPNQVALVFFVVITTCISVSFLFKKSLFL